MMFETLCAPSFAQYFADLNCNYYVKSILSVYSTRMEDSGDIIL